MPKKFLALIIGLCTMLVFAACSKPVVTESQGRIYDDTYEEFQNVFIWLPNNDATASGDSVQLSKERPAFVLDCHGLDTDKKAYVFIDGDIDFPIAELTPDDSTFSITLKAPEKRLDAGEHTVQVVQFDGGKTAFCRTVHYSVE